MHLRKINKTWRFKLIFIALSQSWLHPIMVLRILIFVCLFSGFSLFTQTSAQSADELVRTFSSAINRGNARDLARNFGPNVEISIPRAEGTFSKSQSEIIFRDFFARNIPTSFKVDHQLSSRDGTIYVIGILQTRQGQSYRCYFIIKSLSGSLFLHHIQFDLQ